MRAFIMTSSPCELGVPGMLEKNGQTDMLRSLFPAPFSMLYVCSDPSAHEKTERYGLQMKETFEEKGFEINRFTVLDGRNGGDAARLVPEHDMVFLSGGHVPTQNAFFRETGLREILAGYRGVVMSLSAGSMNAARDVYAAPEEPGEADDIFYRRELEGLGLTNVSIEPHFQITRHEIYGEKRNLEDVLIPDSYARDIYCIPDGSYLLDEGRGQVMHGQCDLIRRGQVIRICEDGGTCEVPYPDVPFEPADTSDLTDGVVRLQLTRYCDRDLSKGWVPAYYFTIALEDGTPVGHCDLRIGASARLYIGGNTGYGIDEPHRGHHYAARAVSLLKILAARHGMPVIYITCAPDNAASAKTCLAAGGVFIEDAAVPCGHDLYIEEGLTHVKVYRFGLTDLKG